MAETLNSKTGFTLPLIEPKRKVLVAALGYVAFCLLYTLTGNVHMRPPVVLAPSPLDERVPFLAWTVWVYHSQFFFLAFVIVTIKRRENFSRTFYSMSLASLLSFLIFVLYPTTLPRTMPTGAGLTAKAFDVLYAIDAATNCLPSLHVSLAWLASVGMLHEEKRLGLLACVWAMLITVSTMTTKQHYLVDVVAGLALAAVCRTMLKGRIEGATAASPRP